VQLGRFAQPSRTIKRRDNVTRQPYLDRGGVTAILPYERWQAKTRNARPKLATLLRRCRNFARDGRSFDLTPLSTRSSSPFRLEISSLRPFTATLADPFLMQLSSRNPEHFRDWTLRVRVAFRASGCSTQADFLRSNRRAREMSEMTDQLQRNLAE
jgi:hypothetical protein